MKNNPLVTVCLFFCLGIWIAKIIHIPLFFLYISCALFLLSALSSLNKPVLFTLSLAFAISLSGIIHLQNAQTYPANHISNFVSDHPQKVYVRGKVVSNPEASQTFYHSKKITFAFRVDDLRIEENWQDVQGLIRVNAYGERKVYYGDELLLQGSLVRAPGERNPGGFDYRAYLADHNIFGLLKVNEKDAFVAIGDILPIRAGTSSRLAWGVSLIRVKEGLRGIVYRHLEPAQAALLSAILLGERSALSEQTKKLFIQTGTVHILAISGLHVGLLALILLALLKALGLGRRIVFALTILILVGYAFLVGARPSVVRATLMAVTVLLGLLINREIKIYNSLALAALVILIVNPNSLFDSGFQLSFSSVISIVYFTPKLKWLFPAFSVSLAAWVGVAPLTAYYFNIVSPVAILANLIVIPLLFLSVAAGISFLIFALLWAPLGAIFSQASSLSLIVLIRLTALISKIPLGFFYCRRPGIFSIAIYYVLLLLIFNYKRLKISFGQVAILLLLLANVLVWKPQAEIPSDKLTVTFLDVGHGDAIFIEFPEKGTMLIDAGMGGENDAGRWVILPFLRNKGLNKIDAVLLTHPDDDHVGGMASVLKDIQVDYVFDNGMSKSSFAYADYRQALVKNVPYYRVIKRGERILGFPEVELSVLHPDEKSSLIAKDDTNNNSLVLKLNYKGVSFLFCGDIQEKALGELLPESSMLKSTVIKVPHHGSYLGRQEKYFFEAVSPQLAVISTDRNERFGFPAPEVVADLGQMDVPVYITADNGAVMISTNGREIWVETMIGAEAGI
ncbi:MAG: DNA internalization-related competence protein ComEC/Rec2 [Candidatus Omnitrophica bacterium]|nr:DNA internalization-related competence protein ComEC/Rec2 [Candidatus Omnitrophota bacterium]